MQVTETKNDGLSREYSVTISGSDLDARVDARLTEAAGDIRVPGFRPGKVPMAVLRQRFANSVLGEVIEKAVSETSREVLEEREIRPIGQPKIEISSFDKGADLVYTIGVDLMPDITPMDFSSISLTRLKPKIEDSEVDEAVERLAKDFRKTEPAPEGKAAASGDVTVIDFVGKVDGVAFDGGTAEGHNLELGSNRFIPGFEDQLIGAKKGDEKQVKVTFPEDYGSAELAGKDAVFDVTVQDVQVYVDNEINEDFAKTLGLESLEQLREQVRERLGADYGNVARSRLKKDLLDVLADGHDFDVPPAMVDGEFEQIWSQVEQAKEADSLDEEDKGKSEDELKADYREIAVRRVKLGMLLSEVGRMNAIEISQEDIQRAAITEAQKYPGQERQVMEFYQTNQEAQASLRAPLMEEKVVDFIVEMAKITDKEVPVAELFDDEPAAKPAKKAAAKKASAKKASAKKAGAKKAAAKKSEAKKAD